MREHQVNLNTGRKLVYRVAHPCIINETLEKTEGPSKMDSPETQDEDKQIQHKKTNKMSNTDSTKN